MKHKYSLQNRSFESKLERLKLKLNHQSNQQKALVFVEGDSDLRLFRKLLPHAVVDYFSGGYTQLEKGLKILIQKYQNVIGIRDADFMHLEGKTPDIPALFLTDQHDTEMMMICSDESLSAIRHEFCAENELPISDFRAKILHGMRFLGYLRWYNHQKKLELNFAGLGFGFFDAKICKIDKKQCVETVLQRSKNAKNIHVDEVLSDVMLLENENDDLTQVCSGHDVSKAISLISGNTSQNHIESHFRTAFTKTEFEKTNLFAHLNTWTNKCAYSLF